MNTPFLTVSDAFRRGTEDAHRIEQSKTFGPAQMHPGEILEACASWKGTLSDHSDTSYFGVEYLRQMRAYWLGRRRAFNWETVWMRPSRRRAEFVVGLTKTASVLARVATMAEAEARIAEYEKTDPEGVHRGDYYIDAPEWYMNERA